MIKRLLNRITDRIADGAGVVIGSHAGHDLYKAVKSGEAYRATREITQKAYRSGREITQKAYDAVKSGEAYRTGQKVKNKLKPHSNPECLFCGHPLPIPLHGQEIQCPRCKEKSGVSDNSETG